jgi:hypothetical protein
MSSGRVVMSDLRLSSDRSLDERDGSAGVAQLWSQVSVILPEQTKRRLAEAAKADRRTVSRQVWEYIERGLAEAARNSSPAARRI